MLNEGEILLTTPYEDICRTVLKTVGRCGESEPERICKSLGITVLYEPMGSFASACKGFFLSQSKKSSIVINSDMSYDLQRIICAHELGHAILHKNMTGVKAFHDVGLFDEANSFEREANLFAAELLLDDDCVFEALNRDTTFFAVAASLRVPMELLDFKFRIMKWKGYSLIEPPVTARSNFLKYVKDDG